MDKSLPSKNTLYSKTMQRILLIGLIAISVVGVYRMRHALAETFPFLRDQEFLRILANKKTIAGVMDKYGAAAHQRLHKIFAVAGISYPPAKLVMLGLKKEEELQIYAADQSGSFKFVKTYPIYGTSGTIGPKLKEGDGQMPEGLYKIQELEPNTPYHVAMRVNYPNEFDRSMGLADKRFNLGGDIMIHGSNGSIGCLAMGDPASEDLFVLIHDVGLPKTSLIMSPFDFRIDRSTRLPSSPNWLAKFYDELKVQVITLPIPKQNS